MGIDRKDVRIVCHYNIPKSMESFYQESGRAGRDQLPSRSVLYYGLDDQKRMEFILRNSSGKKSESSSSNDYPEKSLAAFQQMVEYCENSSCRRKKILESFGEEMCASQCQKSCDSCKYPTLALKHLEELRSVPSKGGGHVSVFINSSIDTDLRVHKTEFWNREDEESFCSEDISDPDDKEAEFISIARSKIRPNSGLDATFEVLKRAEEVYLQNKGSKKKDTGLDDRKVISDSLREASKNRLLNSLKQAKERLRNLPLDFEASAALLELECFTKYSKVGKTFYNSQVAATVRWLSSSSYEQIYNRLGKELKMDNADSGNISVSTAEVASPNSRVLREVTDKEKQDDTPIKGSYEPLVLRDDSMEKISLPPIPSFAEFMNKTRKQGRNSTGSSSNSAKKRIKL